LVEDALGTADAAVGVEDARSAAGAEDARVERRDLSSAQEAVEGLLTGQKGQVVGVERPVERAVKGVPGRGTNIC
jgi:hypothetical protein